MGSASNSYNQQCHGAMSVANMNAVAAAQQMATQSQGPGAMSINSNSSSNLGAHAGGGGGMGSLAAANFGSNASGFQRGVPGNYWNTYEDE